MCPPVDCKHTTTTGCFGQTSSKTFLAISIPSNWHFQDVAMVELMSVHFQHVVEYTTAGHGSKYDKATGGTFMPTLLDIQLISAHIL